jgi:hypothetical protein
MPGAPGSPVRIPAAGSQPVKPQIVADEPISLVDESPSGTQGPSKIRAIAGVGALTGASHTFKRQPFANGQGAVRVRSFHGRLSEEGLDFLDTKVNEWIDQHPEVEVKFVTTQIGVFEGKIREPALIINVWY